MSTRVYVSRDASALSLGAESVAAALATLAVPIELVRIGTRGMIWL